MEFLSFLFGCTREVASWGKQKQKKQKQKKKLLREPSRQGLWGVFGTSALLAPCIMYLHKIVLDCAFSKQSKASVV